MIVDGDAFFRVVDAGFLKIESRHVRGAADCDKYWIHSEIVVHAFRFDLQADASGFSLGEFQMLAAAEQFYPIPDEMFPDDGSGIRILLVEDSTR